MASLASFTELSNNCLTFKYKPLKIKIMLRSDLLLKEVTQSRIEELNRVKDYLICAANGDIEKNDSTALEHLRVLVDMTMELNSLLENLPFITVDLEKLSNS